jgi:signal transduction histidine kinase/ActR/RegA family two-component response regulator
MNLFVVATFAIAALQLAFGLVLLSVLRAPGWRGVWPFAAVAISAGVFSVINIAFSAPVVGDTAIVWWMRCNVVIAAINTASWVTFSFADEEGRLRSLPAVARAAMVLTILAGVALAATGAHLVPGQFVDHMGSDSPGRYRLGESSTIGVAFGGWCLTVISISLWAYVRRARREGRAIAGFTIGLVVFCLCAINEMLVLTGVVRFYSLGDIGSLAIIIPVTRGILERFVDDARRLRAMSDRLSGEVEERTQERDQAQAALLEAERHAALGRIAAGVGHEINNPLTYLSLNLETVEQWAVSAPIPNDVGQAMHSVRDASTRIARVVEGLRLAGRVSSGHRVRLDPVMLCENALRVAAPQLRHSAEIVRQLDPAPMVDGDEAKLVQVLVNLLTNAAIALADHPPAQGGRIHVRTSTTANGDALIAVTDNGPGIKADDLDRVTEPYFTTRASSGGTGLGLFLAREMVEQHHGLLAIDSADGRGTTVRVVLPPARAAANGRPVGAEQRESHALTVAPRTDTSPGSILIVDDEPQVLHALSRALTAEAAVVSAGTGRDALELIDRGLDPAVIVCDLMMPGMSGIELRDALRARGKASAERIVFVTGGAVTDEAREFVERGDVTVLFKPLTTAELRDAVRALATRSL